MVVGPSILLVYAWVEVLNNPGLTLVDGYRIGRTPWTPIGLVIALAGGVAGLLSGSLAIAIEGGWWRRLLAAGSVAVATIWWALALTDIPDQPKYVPPDALRFAHTLPVAAILLVLMPAALIATLALTTRMQTPPRTRLRPVPPPQTTAAQRSEDDSDVGGIQGEEPLP